MLKAPLKLADARVLLTNDDGIDAPGLAALEDALRGKVRQLVTVAPERNQSGCGHTVAVAHPIRLRQLSEHRFAVDSTPPDCVIMGVREVMQGVAPDLVISGINKGHNIGEYVHYSGTCAACYEAGLMRLPSIALSQQMAASGRMILTARRAGWPSWLSAISASHGRVIVSSTSISRRVPRCR